jgi:ABC-type cobalamin/Fe3+-siderophores transport system ATPase subunit
MIAGQLTPDSGSVTIGAAVKMGYFAQHAMDILVPHETVIESLQRQFPMASLGIMKNLAGAFGFRGYDTEKPCRILSGGEKARLVLAGLLYDPPNFLVLDEPTNHLDMDTKRMLIDSLSNYEGTMVFVSHDRAFLARAAAFKDYTTICNSAPSEVLGIMALRSRERILASVWGTHEDPLTNIVDVYIRRLRSKVDEGFEPALIHTQRGLGYRLEAPGG